MGKSPPEALLKAEEMDIRNMENYSREFLDGYAVLTRGDEKEKPWSPAVL